MSGAVLSKLPPAAIRARSLVALVVAAFAAWIALSGWLCDDAFLALRTADNFLHGRGLRWNPAERVQVYASPPWLLLVAAVGRVTRELPLTTLIVSVVLSAGVLVVAALRPGLSARGFALFALALGASKVFVDFSTSGLETPQSHLLVALFLLAVARAEERPGSPLVPALCAGLVALDRVGSLPLVLPALVHVLRRAPGGRLRAVVLGASPLLAWELFSLFYYGSLVPNPVLARLASDVPRVALLGQGAHYLFWTLAVDPVAPVLVALGVGVGLAGRGSARFPVALGVLAQLAAVAWTGGDHLPGRALSTVVLAGAWLLAGAASRLGRPASAVLAATLLYAGLWHPDSPLRAAAGAVRSRSFADVVESSGILDERALTALTLPALWRSEVQRLDADAAAGARAEGVVVRGSVGAFAFAAGPTVHVVDPYARCDPFLARLPEVERDWWTKTGMRIRPGHLRRALPPGYARGLRSGDVQLADPDLAALHARMERVTRGPLLDGRRLRDVAALLLGAGASSADEAALPEPGEARPREGG